MRETYFDHIDFSNEQLRIMLDAKQAYETWVEAERELAAIPYNFQWKSIGGNNYLYQTPRKAPSFRAGMDSS